MANATLLGTVATLVLLLASASVPAVVGAGARVAVKVPDEPAVRVSGFGMSCVGVGRIGVPYTVIVSEAPGVLATVTVRVLGPGLSAMVRSTAATFCPKSAGPATCTLFTVIQAAEIRFWPFAWPLTMCRRNGAPTLGETVTVSVYWFGAPLVRTYCFGPNST